MNKATEHIYKLAAELFPQAGGISVTNCIMTVSGGGVQESWSVHIFDAPITGDPSQFNSLAFGHGVTAKDALDCAVADYSRQSTGCCKVKEG